MRLYVNLAKSVSAFCACTILWCLCADGSPKYANNGSDCAPVLLKVRVNGLCGYSTIDGRMRVEAKYTDASDRFSEGLASVQIDGKFGFIDSSGKTVIAPQFLTCHRFSEGVAAAQDFGTKKFGYIDRTGKYAILPKFDQAKDFQNGVAEVATETLSGKLKTATADVGTSLDWSCVDHEGSVIQANGHHDWLSVCRQGDKVGFCDLGNNPVIDPLFDKALPFSELRAAVMIGKKWGFIDSCGKTIVEPQFTAVRSFSDGLAAVMQDGTWGYIDSVGHMVIAPQFTMAYDFQDGVAVVYEGNRSGWIKPDGKYALSPNN